MTTPTTPHPRRPEGHPSVGDGGPTPRRPICIGDTLWARTKAHARERGISAAAVVRRALEGYLGGGERP